MLHILKTNVHTVTTVCDVHLKDRIDKYFDYTLDDNYDSFVVYAKRDNVITNYFYVHLTRTHIWESSFRKCHPSIRSW